ncbi:MAG: hypothetical protein LUQ07_02915 [Methanospirillum sp.]|nr:hypothetical protein [Methanospirillum sp.]
MQSGFLSSMLILILLLPVSVMAEDEWAEYADDTVTFRYPASFGVSGPESKENSELYTITSLDDPSVFLMISISPSTGVQDEEIIMLLKGSYLNSPGVVDISEFSVSGYTGIVVLSHIDSNGGKKEQSEYQYDDGRHHFVLLFRYDLAESGTWRPLAEEIATSLMTSEVFSPGTGDGCGLLISVSTEYGVVSISGSSGCLSPGDEMSLWILSDSMILLRKIEIEDEGRFLYEIPLDELPDEWYYLVILHPGADRESVIYPDDPLDPTTIYYRDNGMEKILGSVGDDSETAENLVSEFAKVIDRGISDDLLYYLVVDPHDTGEVSESDCFGDETFDAETCP